MALFLKYRPQSFQDLVGQESVVRTLQNALKATTPAHAYLFSGSRGTGKTSTARIFAKGLICQNIQDKAQKEKLCQQITDGSLVDVIEIDGASNRGIDEIRDLREKIQFAPNIADKKVYIIDEVHMLTTAAFNALLKTLEEPPEHAYFLLATTEMHKLPDTIISRCQSFIFHRFSLEQLIRRLEYICTQEQFTFENDALELIARKAEGGLRDAISLLDQIAAETDNTITKEAVISSLGMSTIETLDSFYEALLDHNQEAAFSVLQKINSSGGDFRTFGHDLLGYLRQKMHENISDTAQLSIILDIIAHVEKAIAKLKTTPLVELPFEIAVINITNKQTHIHAHTPIENKKESSKTPAKETQYVGTKESPTLPSEAATKKEERGTHTPSYNGFEFDDEPPKSSKSSKEAKSTPPPSKTKTRTAPKNTGSLTAESLTENMKAIVEKAGLPSYGKMAFLATKPRIDGPKIFFESENDFYITKLKNNMEFKPQIQEAIQTIFSQKITVEFVSLKRHVPQKDAPASADDFSDW